MIALGVIPILFALGLFLFAHQLAGQLRPAAAVPLLTGLALSVALCTGLVLSAIAVLVCAQWGPLPALGQWSASTLRSSSGLPAPVGISALAIVVICLATAAVHAIRSLRALRGTAKATKLLQPVTGNLVLIDDEVPTAYSVGAFRGRIVVSTSMLSALTGPERRVLLSHEAAHLRHHHHLYLQLARLAAVANPLLRPTANAIAGAVERWADEDAAAEVGDRKLVACALARAALARAAHPTARHVLAVADDHVVERVQQLLIPAFDQKRMPIAAVMAAGVLTWVATGGVALWANGIIQLAERAYLRS
ncbi:M48 family metalloprotease [Jatrophihabitans sp. DSM 45814]